MGTDKKYLQKLWKSNRDELSALEAKCKDGSATKEEYQELTKLRRKMK